MVKENAEKEEKRRFENRKRLEAEKEKEGGFTRFGAKLRIFSASGSTETKEKKKLNSLEKYNLCRKQSFLCCTVFLWLGNPEVVVN